MKWIGLTGGIATGKSTVSRILESRGYPVIDADAIVHRLLQPGQLAHRKVVSHFGTQILNEIGHIDRKILGEVVFKDPTQRKELELIIHPEVQKEVSRERQEFEMEGERYSFYDVPLLFENNLIQQFDLVVTVWCEPVQQLSRLMARSKLTEQQARERIASQLPLIEKIKASHYCLDNSGQDAELIYIVSSYCDQLDRNRI